MLESLRARFGHRPPRSVSVPAYRKLTAAAVVRGAWLCSIFLLGVLAGPERAAAQSVWVGFDKVLRVNGDRFFPIGLLSLGIERYPDDWNDRIRDSGANLVWDLGFAYAESLYTCEALRDSAEATGYYLMTGSFDTWEWDNPNTPEAEVDIPMYDPGPLNDLDRCFPGNSVHLAYANRDEPVWTIARQQIGNIDSLHVIETYDQIKDEDQHRPVALNFAPAHVSKDLQTWKDDIAGYLQAGSTDIVMFAAYPYPPGPGTCGDVNVVGYPDCTMDRLPEAIDMFLDELNEPGQPLWTVVQGHKAIPLKESRWTFATSIVNGATGVMVAGWTWFHPLGHGSANWDVTKQVVSEYSSIAESLARAKLDGVSSSETDVEVTGKQDFIGDAMVIAATRNDFVGNATISLPGGVVEEGAWIEVLFEDRWIPVVNGEFTDSFSGYDSHVYRLWNQGPATSVTAQNGSVNGLQLRVFPNPAVDEVRASFAAATPGPIQFAVYDVTGRRVTDLSAGSPTEDQGEIVWDGRDLSGARVPSGIYFLRGKHVAGYEVTERVVLR